MHEAGIVQELIEAFLDRIKNNRDMGRVKKIYVKIGDAMGLTEESFKFWFENLSKGTELENVLLEISSVKGREVIVDSFEAGAERT